LAVAIEAALAGHTPLVVAVDRIVPAVAADRLLAVGHIVVGHIAVDHTVVVIRHIVVVVHMPLVVVAGRIAVRLRAVDTLLAVVDQAQTGCTLVVVDSLCTG